MNKKQENIILFDGVCNLCNKSVIFILKRDSKSIFKFTSLQSHKGQKILNNYGLQANDFDSFVLIKDGRSYLKSTAGLMVLKILGWP